MEFDKKYKILNLFKKICLDKLNPLKLEEEIRLIRDSPISIVAEVLSLYDNGQIETKNIDLDNPLEKSAEECEIIINKYFNVKNQNYYNKMNFIKILSLLFKKLTNNIYLDYNYIEYQCNKNKIKLIRKTLIKNFIEFAKIFSLSPFDAILKQEKFVDISGKFDENQIIEEIDYIKNESIKLKKLCSVFFNKDGQSLSIISNNKANDSEYNILKSLWNLQNFDSNNSKDLVDYKNLNHEGFLEQVKFYFP